MKKTLLLIPIVAMLAACGTTDHNARIAERQYDREVDSVKTTLSNTPDWCKDKASISTDAIFACGHAIEKNKEWSEQIATMQAKGKICDYAGGTVTKKADMYQNSETIRAESFIRSQCEKTDLTGASVSKKVVIRNGNRVETFVEIQLPTGLANVQKTAKAERKSQADADVRFKELKTEMDKQQ